MLSVVQKRVQYSVARTAYMDLGTEHSRDRKCVCYQTFWPLMDAAAAVWPSYSFVLCIFSAKVSIPVYKSRCHPDVGQVLPTCARGCAQVLGMQVAFAPAAREAEDPHPHTWITTVHIFSSLPLSESMRSSATTLHARSMHQAWRTTPTSAEPRTPSLLSLLSLSSWWMAQCARSLLRSCPAPVACAENPPQARPQACRTRPP